MVNVLVDDRSDVDDLHGRALSLGGQSLKSPYDAFWGARYCVVQAPGTLIIGIMSVPDVAHRSPVCHVQAEQDLLRGLAPVDISSYRVAVFFEPPDELPILQRVAVRLVVIDADDRVLLLHTHDPTYPELGKWWELPGGGVEPGESLAEAAVRELHEETSICVDTTSLGAPSWHRHASFRYRGTRHVQCETLLTVEVALSSPAVDGAHRVGYEDEDYFDFSWWTLADIENSPDRFYPGQLAVLLRRHLAGEAIEEPFELWS